MNPRIKLDRDRLWRLLDGAVLQVPTSVGLLEVEGESNPWVPLKKLDPTPPHMVKAHEDAGVPSDIEVWSNGTYEVIVTRDERGAAHLSIKRMDRAPIRNWRHFQQMKNEIVGEDVEGLELYPAEDRLADNANQYHLFTFPPGERLPIGFPEGLVNGPDAIASMPGRGRQEPWQPGLTTGKEGHG